MTPKGLPIKKLFALLAAAALIMVGATPVQAGTSTVPATGDFSAWSNYSLDSGLNVSVSGSLVEGQVFTVSASGSCPASRVPGQTANFSTISRSIIAYAQIGGAWIAGGENISVDGASIAGGDSISVFPGISLTSSPITAGSAGTSSYFASLVYCNYSDGRSEIRSEILKVTFEAPQLVGTPSNFSVFPQAGGTAFATWGVPNGATGYQVTTRPGGHSCVTTQNFCTITGLTIGGTYTFTLTATNGGATSTVSSDPVVMRELVTVGVGVQGGTWRSGETVTAQYVVQGSNVTPTISWYRCNGPVGAMPTPPQPGECSAVGSGASYVLSSGDVGKYITAHVFVNNTDPLGQMTANSNQAVLTAGAVAPPAVADPTGKPTIVNIPNPIVSITGGTQVIITGTGLGGVIAVTVGGLPAIVISKTDTTVVVQVPISTQVGLADLTITNAQGSVTSKSAIVYTTNPAIKITKTKSITGFTASSKVLSAAQKSAVRSLITANPTLTQLSCAAKTVGVAASKSELAKAKSLATATCAYAKTLKKPLVTSASASQSLPKSKASRTVLLTLKN